VHIDGLGRQFRLCCTVGDGAMEGPGSIQLRQWRGNRQACRETCCAAYHVSSLRRTLLGRMPTRLALAASGATSCCGIFDNILASSLANTCYGMWQHSSGCWPEHGSPRLLRPSPRVLRCIRMLPCTMPWLLRSRGRRGLCGSLLWRPSWPERESWCTQAILATSTCNFYQVYWGLQARVQVTRAKAAERSAQLGHVPQADAGSMTKEICAWRAMGRELTDI